MALLSASSSAENRTDPQDFRIVLPTLIGQVGSGWQSTILLSQVFANGQPQPVTILRDGKFTATDLADLEDVVQNGRTLEVRRPLVIWQSASLSIDGYDIVLRRDLGAFMLSLGDVELKNTQFRGEGPVNIDAPAFGPFLLVAGAASLIARDVTFSDLGFRSGPPYGGITVVNRGIYQPAMPTDFRNVSILNSGTVALIGVEEAQLHNVTIMDAKDTALRLEGNLGTRLSDIVIRDTSGHGIRVTRQSAGVQISGAKIGGAKTIGLFIDQDSRDLEAGDVEVTDSGVAGLFVTNARCVNLTNLQVSGSQASGVIVASAKDIYINGLSVTESRGAGVSLRNQKATARVTLADVTLQGNTRGIEGAQIGNVSLSRVDVSQNLPRQVAGDFVVHHKDILRAHGENVTLGTAIFETRTQAETVCKSVAPQFE